jgi:hypothetical protein
MLEELDAIYASQAMTSSAMIVAKRTVPANWTPQPSRSAPGGRNTIEEGDEDQEASPLRSKSREKRADPRPLSNVSNQQRSKSRDALIPEVIDLT